MDSRTPEPATPGCAIGLDVGGTKIAGALVSGEGKLMGKRVIPTLPRRGGEAVLADALKLAGDLLAEAHARRLNPVAIGVGVGELVDLEGNVASAQTIAWRGLPVRERFAALAPSLVEADARAAGFCEARFGAGRPLRSFLYVTVGTGIGSSLMLDGEPYRGARGSTGTLASGALTTLCRQCGARVQTVVEQVASGPALVARYTECTRASVTKAEEVLAAAAAGDAEAVYVVQTAAEALGSTIALLVGVLDPEAVIVGGGLGSAPGLYWENLVASTRRHIWSDTHRDLPLLQAACGGDAGVIGAGALAWEQATSRVRAAAAPAAQP